MIPRPTFRLACAALAAAGLAACGGPGKARVDAAASVPEGAESHDEKRYVVSYGAEPYRVNVRYVGMIGQSVIAIRRGVGDASSPAWGSMPMAPGVSVPEAAPFADTAWEAVALDIADQVGREGKVCDSGKAMVIREAGGDTKTMYRQDRQAWVVFARCPEKAGG